VPWHRLERTTNSGANKGLISKIERMAKRVEKDAASDSELVGRCLQGDEAAWSELIGRYQRLVYSVAYALCPDPDDTADVFQATCLDLYKGLPLLRDIKALPAWLITVTRRRSIAVLRARIPTSNSDEDMEELGQAHDVIQAIEHEHAIERALEQLPDRCRALINLLYFSQNQPTYQEISDKLGIPVPSIGPTRARCLDKLKKILT